MGGFVYVWVCILVNSQSGESTVFGIICTILNNIERESKYKGCTEVGDPLKYEKLIIMFISDT